MLKEKESAADRPVTGRQVLLMMDEFFGTNIKHGAMYSLKDLFAVKLKGERKPENFHFELGHGQCRDHTSSRSIHVGNPLL